jgi:hypothetical protein
MHADLRQLSQQVTKERELYKIKVTEAFVPIRDLFIKHCEVRYRCPVRRCCMVAHKVIVNLLGPRTKGVVLYYDKRSGVWTK